ncbi:DUF72 domain-containing protein [Solihabitans fulvus]|uniref:DUF72 domain-containing protein n=1 Tax=Solihabitans fulvus TaxID=1892852 RepID=A0A5B2WVM2_9PSEU|nr:DUF72 domain-containing protein [Solihabitans fulvus]KAA2254964.1 DUF72 domain-containing protein [Solihabitans fulvus]
MSGDVRIGTSGWVYPPWRGGAFYPKGLPQRSELAHLSGRLGSVELNGSFYALQRPTSYQSWAEQTPDDFVFAIKGGRFVTHLKRLRDAEDVLPNFFASGVLALGPKLGPVLWQLPPNLPFDRDLLSQFFDQLPRDTVEAARLAKRHDERLDGRAHTTTDADRPIRHALEVRHNSFCTPEFVELLRANDIALVVADTTDRFPSIHDVTADFVYVRMHGDHELYVSGYTDEALDAWVRRIRTWRDGRNVRGEHTLAAPAPVRSAGRDVYVYFDNTAKVHAPENAVDLARRLGVGPAID